MLLSKQIAVYLNLAGCKLKQYFASNLKKNGVNLTPEQFLLLDILWNEGAMSQQQMADTLMKDKNSITKLADALEEKKLICRILDTKDKRSNILTLTEVSLKMKSGVKEIGIETLDKMIDGISESDLLIFLSVLAKMNENMNKVK